MENEEVIGSIQVCRPKLGIISRTIYETLCFTSNRLIINQAESWAADGILSSTLGYWSANKKRNELAESIKKLSPDEILKAHKDNYEIAYSNISKVELTKGLRYTVRVFEGSKKHQWYIDRDKKRQYEECGSLVDVALPGKLSKP